jgi:hypothetical protein
MENKCMDIEINKPLFLLFICPHHNNWNPCTLSSLEPLNFNIQNIEISLKPLCSCCFHMLLWLRCYNTIPHELQRKVITHSTCLTSQS